VVAVSNDDSIFNENGVAWGGGRRDLTETLESYYGVDNLWLQAGYWDEDRQETVMDVLIYMDEDHEVLLAEDLEMHSHPPSGAVGVSKDSLPVKSHVEETVRETVGDAA
jgi:hypothetical protein